MMQRILMSFVALLLVLPLAAQPAGKRGNKADPADNAPARPGGPVDQAAVDKAIDKGLAFLRTRMQGAELPTINSGHGIFQGKPYEELLLYTCHHAGMSEKDPIFRRLLAATLNKPFDKTYNVALQVMALDAIDRTKYASRFPFLAQWLVDEQCENGQWSYGDPMPGLVPTRATETEKAEVVETKGTAGPQSVAPPPAASPAGPAKPGTAAMRTLKHTRKGKPCGDNSNTQYALLALKVCLDNGVAAPHETFERAEQWWLKCLRGDGGWAYGYNGKYAEKGVPTLPGMTVGGIGSVAICRFGKHQDFKSSELVRKGLGWMVENWTVSNSKRDDNEYLFYYLYGLSRAGLLCSLEKIGPHDWYQEGAAYLLKEQRPDGSWEGKSKSDDAVTSTCFAILFLRRATRPIVYSEVSKTPAPKAEGNAPAEKPDTEKDK